MNTDEYKGRYFLYKWWLIKRVKKFRSMGYQNVSPKDLWDYLIHLRWKHESPKTFRQKVHDIKKIKPNDYFTYESLKATVYQVPSLEDIDLKDLF